MKIFAKLIIYFSVIGLILATTIGLVSYFNARKNIQDNQINYLQTIAKLKANTIEGFFNDLLKSISLYQGSNNIKSNLPILSGSDSQSQEFQASKSILDAQLIQAQNILKLSDILLLDSAGKLVYETNPKYLDGAEKIIPDIYAKAFSEGKEKTYITDVFVNTREEKQFSVLVSAPVIVKNKFIGVIEFEADIRSLYSLVQDTAGLGTTGETLLVKKNGNNVLFLTPSKYDLGAALNKVVVIGSNTGAPLQAAAQGESGSGLTIDYRGQQVIAVWFPLRVLPWGFVAKIDASEAFASTFQLRNFIIIFCVFLLLLIFGISFFIAKSISDPIRRLEEGAEIIGKGNLDYRVKVEGKDEEAQLARDFNEMAEKLKAANTDLEGQIETRTFELAEVRDALLNIAEDLEGERSKSEKGRVEDEAILQSIGESLIVTDENGLITMMNSAAEEILKIDLKDFIGKLVYKVLPIQDENGQKIEEKNRPIYISLKSGRVVDEVCYYVRKDGTKFPASITSSPIILAGKTIGAVDVFRDITKEKEVDRAKTEFVSLASHQLRTPISAIKWYSEMLLFPGKTKVGKLSVKQRQYVDEIYHGNERMIKLINNLLNISRIELGKLTVTLAPLDIKDLTQKIVKDHQPKIEEKKQKIVLVKTEELPKIYGDQTLLTIVIDNLISNAVKYTKEGGEIDFKITKDKNNVLFEIKDNGIGIPKDEQKRIFDKLFRSSNAMEVYKEGTGLGLYIVKAVVEAMGGKIWFESQKDHGTSFFFTIPFRKAVENNNNLVV